MNKKQKKLVIKSLENMVGVSKIIIDQLYQDAINEKDPDKGESFEAFASLSTDTTIVEKYLTELKQSARVGITWV